MNKPLESGAFFIASSKQASLSSGLLIFIKVRISIETCAFFIEQSLKKLRGSGSRP